MERVLDREPEIAGAVHQTSHIPGMRHRGGILPATRSAPLAPIFCIPDFRWKLFSLCRPRQQNLVVSRRRRAQRRYSKRHLYSRLIHVVSLKFPQLAPLFYLDALKVD